MTFAQFACQGRFWGRMGRPLLEDDRFRQVTLWKTAILKMPETIFYAQTKGKIPDGPVG